LKDSEPEQVSYVPDCLVTVIVLSEKLLWSIATSIGRPIWYQSPNVSINLKILLNKTRVKIKGWCHYVLWIDLDFNCCQS